MTYILSFDTSFFVIISLLFISVGYSAIIHFNYSFLHLLLIFEMIFLSICFFFSLSGFIVDQIDGEIMALFIIGIVAAETAIGISFYINTIVGLPEEKKNIEKEKFNSKEKHQLLVVNKKYFNPNKFIIFNDKK